MEENLKYEKLTVVPVKNGYIIYLGEDKVLDSNLHLIKTLVAKNMAQVASLIDEYIRHPEPKPENN